MNPICNIVLVIMKFVDVVFLILCFYYFSLLSGQSPKKVCTQTQSGKRTKGLEILPLSIQEKQKQKNFYKNCLHQNLWLCKVHNNSEKNIFLQFCLMLRKRFSYPLTCQILSFDDHLFGREKSTFKTYDSIFLMLFC